jgi:hypothetical protein
MLLTIPVAIAGLYLVLLATMYFAQGWLIYPAPKGPGGQSPGFERIAYRTVDGLTLWAGYRAAVRGKPTILYFHGNGADWQSSVAATDRLVAEGYGVLAAEYRGYRGNPGSPDEQGLYRDGRAAIEWLRKRGVLPDEIVLVGNSIGSGVAVQMATEFEPRALVLISPFASLSHIVSEKFRWAPTNLLLRDRFANVDKMGQVAAPILLLHGDADTLIPSHHSRILSGATPEARLTIFPGAGHELAWKAAAQREMLQFLEAVLPNPASPEPSARYRPGHRPARHAPR